MAEYKVVHMNSLEAVDHRGGKQDPLLGCLVV